MHWARPRTHRSIALNVKVGLRLIDDLCEAMQPACIPRCTADTLQLEDGFDDLDDRQLRIGRARAVVEPCAVEVVRGQRPARVDSCRIREVQQL